MSLQSDFFTTNEVLTLLNCSKSALINYIKRNKFPSPLKFSYDGRIPSRTAMARYPKSEVLAWFRDMSAEAHAHRQPYTPLSSPLQLSPDVDIDRALSDLKEFLDNYDSCKRVLRKVRSPESCTDIYSLPWYDMKEGIVKMLPSILRAASAVGIDVEGLVRS